MSQKQADKKSAVTIGDKVKKAVGIIIPTLSCVAAALYISTVYNSDISLLASVNGEEIGYVNSTSVFYNAKTRLALTVGEVTDGSYSTDYDITYDLVTASNPETVNEVDAAEILWSDIQDDFTEAYVLYVDDRQAAANTSGTSLKGLISDIEDDLLATAGNLFGGVKISNDIRIEKQLCLKSMVKTAEEIDGIINPLAGIETGAVETAAEHSETVVTRINAPLFAAPSVISEETAAKADNTGDKDLKLDYNFVNTVTLSEVIYHKTEYAEDPYTFKGNERITQKGHDGVKTVTYEILYDTSGNIVGRNVIAETVVTEAVDMIITVGTAEIPDAVSTGSLIWPCDTPDGVSSYYGWRYLFGRPDFHLGIDIPDKLGSPIWAADGGEVVFVGRTYSYGNSVRIQHNDGVTTVYAHLNTMSVSEGDKVCRGQNIGTMGRTGVATGNHLHFEVRINDQTTDPMKYLPEL